MFSRISEEWINLVKENAKQRITELKQKQELEYQREHPNEKMLYLAPQEEILNQENYY